jgi:hypothetical protein
MTPLQWTHERFVRKRARRDTGARSTASVGLALQGCRAVRLAQALHALLGIEAERRRGVLAVAAHDAWGAPTRRVAEGGGRGAVLCGETGDATAAGRAEGCRAAAIRVGVADDRALVIVAVPTVRALSVDHADDALARDGVTDRRGRAAIRVRLASRARAVRGFANGVVRGAVGVLYALDAPACARIAERRVHRARDANHARGVAGVVSGVARHPRAAGRSSGADFAVTRHAERRRSSAIAILRAVDAPDVRVARHRARDPVHRTASRPGRAVTPGSERDGDRPQRRTRTYVDSGTAWFRAKHGFLRTGGSAPQRGRRLTYLSASLR